MTEFELEQQKIDHGLTVKAFFESEAGVAAIKRAVDRTYAEWADSKTPEERERAWARGRAITDMVNEFSATIAVAETATNMKKHRERVSGQKS